MSRPRLLDLFCGAGGAAMGYHRAGFDVVGVDIKARPSYPFHMVRADALEALATWNLERFSAIHASPPCLAYSVCTRFYRSRRNRLWDRSLRTRTGWFTRLPGWVA